MEEFKKIAEEFDNSQKVELKSECFIAKPDDQTVDAEEETNKEETNKEDTQEDS